jgi:hypothetical protein
VFSFLTLDCALLLRSKVQRLLLPLIGSSYKFSLTYHRTVQRYVRHFAPLAETTRGLDIIAILDKVKMLNVHEKVHLII